MTKTLRNLLLVVAALVFGGFAIRDGLRHDVRGALEDLFIGCMVSYVFLRISQAPKRRAGSESL